MKKKKTVERMAADVLLEREVTVTLGGVDYSVPPPTMATLIAASELISGLPAVKLDPKDVLAEVLLVAPDCRDLGKIAAVLVKGVPRDKDLSAREKRRRSKGTARFADFLMRTATPYEMRFGINRILNVAGIDDFFGLTTSLTEINLLRRTRRDGEVVGGTTASGRSSSG
jgi:hypothetical protein